MLKKITIRLIIHIVFPISEWLIKHKNLDFYNLYYVIRVGSEDYLKGMDFSDFVKLMHDDVYGLLKSYPECYKWCTEAALLAWKFYNT